MPYLFYSAAIAQPESGVTAHIPAFRQGATQAVKIENSAPPRSEPLTHCRAGQLGNRNARSSQAHPVS